MNRIIVIYLVLVLLFSFSFWLVWFALSLLGPASRLGVDNYQAHRHPYYWGVF